jgi:hypothetical protein
MPLFSLFIRCDGVGELVTQSRGANPYDAIKKFLSTNTLRTMTAVAPDWPADFAIRDCYAFIPLQGLQNAYFCGLGAQGKYVQINIFQTAQRSTADQRYCGPRRKMVTLR